MRSLAILRDSFRETLDCKTFWILLAVSTLFVGLAWSVSFNPLEPGDTIAGLARELHRFQVGRMAVRHPVEFEAADVKEDGKGGYDFRLRAFPAAALHKLVRQWDAAARGRVKKPRDPVPDVDLPTDADLRKAFLVSQFRARQLLRVTVEPEPSDETEFVFRVSVRPERPELFHGGHRVNVLFGLFSVRLPLTAALTMATVHIMLGNLIAGIAGFLVAMIITGMFVPDMLQKGRIDVLLSRPIGRGTLLLYKYLGGLLFVLLNVVYLVGGSWLGLAARTGIWNPAFLLTIPILMLVFAVFYAFSVWMAVFSRSALVSILCTIALWVSSLSAGSFHDRARDARAESVFPAWFEKVVEGIYYLLPKTSDLTALNTAVIMRSHLGEEAAAALPMPVSGDPSAWPVYVASSVIMLGVFLACAIVVFKRRDY